MSFLCCAINIGDSSQIPAGQLTWINYQEGTNTSLISMNLTAGDHTVKLTEREGGVSVDRLIFTSDPTCVPTGTGDNCPAPTLTPTPTPTPIPNNDTIAPAVSITSPTNGAIVRRSSLLTIQAQASDNIGVTRVEFSINGTLMGTDTTAPYTYNWSVPGKPNSTYTLSAKAYDAAGNVGTSNTVTVKTNK